ncbi:hypothetical protein B1992_01875 [Pseudoxanthomonas broegbernensis]|uniref:Uncharacterized protein n=1 Tax=Pseudoxanthomonas broegbernensis TaxID=83619 RepID=A0A7V8GQG3_9GAMM|nr:hypothetical protein [Pseudoxanthomonas broegbernensis]KAF1688186.1 hypothetical protein B1992_01875 [Pseudoxanthomonas broegbernensis]MBB6065240.1 hypothetical protein [Pseudoxanthomonas broegbernensis]
MRHWLPMLLVLPLAHCSCQRQPEPAPEPAALHAETVDPAAAAAAEAARATAEAGRQAVATVHAYLGALPGTDRPRADAYWSGGGPGDPAGDAVLRGHMPGLRGMRIENDRPQALDRQSPPRAYEVPVRLRLDDDAGSLRLRGYYRLRARIDGGGWEITSASLQPAFD